MLTSETEQQLSKERAKDPPAAFTDVPKMLRFPNLPCAFAGTGVGSVGSDLDPLAIRRELHLRTHFHFLTSL